MAEQEESQKGSVQANDKSVAVGDIRVGGSAGNISISRKARSDGYARPGIMPASRR